MNYLHSHKKFKVGLDDSFLNQARRNYSTFQCHWRSHFLWTLSDHMYELRWYQLKSKAGQENKTKLRGDIEVRIAFTVKSGTRFSFSPSASLNWTRTRFFQGACWICPAKTNCGTLWDSWATPPRRSVGADSNCFLTVLFLCIKIRM